ncbi:hypothetical protein MMPV_005714 [Pyropia vietnamensis]
MVPWAIGYAALWAIAGGAVAADALPRLSAALGATPPLPNGVVGTAAAAVCAYVVGLVALGAALPGPVVTGTRLADGSRLTYKCNGLAVAAVTVAVAVGAVSAGVLPGDLLVTHYLAVLTAANGLAVALTVYLVVGGRVRRRLAAGRPPRPTAAATSAAVGSTAPPPTHGGGSDAERPLWLDVVLGAELNPHIAGVDVKFFSYRPAMIGWLLLNLSFAYAHVARTGSLSARMGLYQALSAIYIIDYFLHEAAMTSTWDIIAERFGLMLIWGDYVFIPFGFSVQLWYLLPAVGFAPLPPLHPAVGTAIAALFVGGMVTFRGANSQKHAFRVDPKRLVWGRPPVTAAAGRLLASGWWGLARHINYTGDLAVAAALVAPVGAGGAGGYFYFVYLLLLVVHRERRDDRRCAAKYERDWADYCRRVPWHMVPGVY